MKKTILTSIALGFVVSSFAQGYINFGNGSTTTVTTNNTQYYTGVATQVGTAASGVTTGSGAAPSGYYYALLYQTYSGTAAANSIDSLGSEGWTFSGATATNSLAAGRFTGGADVPVTGTTAGGNYQFIVVGWSASEGSTWSTIANLLTTGNQWTAPGYVGVSSVGVINGIAGASPSTPSTLFGSSPAIASGFTLWAVPVPEPTTMALAALGGAAMLLIRRKK